MARVLDEIGLLHVGGRLDKSKLCFDSKHPIIFLPRHHKWATVLQNLAVSDVILLKDEVAARNEWPLCLVEEFESDDHGFVRSVLIRCEGKVIKTGSVLFHCVLTVLSLAPPSSWYFGQSSGKVQLACSGIDPDSLNNTHFGENHTFASKKLRKSQFCLSYQYDQHNTHCDYRGYVV
ncbi:hypothetical protein CAPTEDRAFT_209340 [Capitella teleta]|uniref:DUF5641 domain-containing protein n=1 Tax=Capitella teleta TaxID=283909 RepID=R7TKE9_CAPTE|nr:hypothetical protein CAPTEDRAFT_209340 [Capitella teleta]|eukprot:ELT92016.1 hypothetical protein CAPTEDRAFT_209340 [Capitella teleta]